MRVDTSAFEGKYQAHSDPWDFSSSSYELGRYRAIVEQLSPFGYRRCFEPGCSIGVLTDMLANHAEHVVACDVSATAIEAARVRTKERDNVELVVATIPDWWPDGTFDVIVLSEFGYYWDENGLRDLLRRLVASADTAGTDLIAAHWLGQSADHLLDGSDVHRLITEQLGESVVESVPPAEGSDSGYVLARWRLSS